MDEDHGTARFGVEPSVVIMLEALVEATVKAKGRVVAEAFADVEVFI